MSDTPDPHTLSRRTFVRSAGTAAVVAGLAPTLVGRAAAAPVALNAVNLFMETTSPEISTGGTATLTLHVGNAPGANTTLSPATVFITTPYFYNLGNLSSVTGSPLPVSASVLYSNPAPNVPEVAQITIPAGLAPGTLETLTIPLVQLPNAPALPADGRATVHAGPLDTDTDVTRNSRGFQPVLDSSAVPPPGNPDLYFTYTPAVFTNAASPASLHVTVFNNSGLPLVGLGAFTYVTPIFTNLGPVQPLGTTVLYSNTDPFAPSIIQVSTIDLALLPYSFAIQLLLTHGAPRGTYGTNGIVYPARPAPSFDASPATQSMSIVQLVPPS
ncbi:hypothetical protein F0L68_24820 [Solihabitans fulvus]|uniref:Uncharacterized protein n=1 Tax=Solihabitans fulvus TaxID=1892852 RepID=A0A5B2X2X7_9PSEU|nr:hypothetical protein [Solihabitans fulvus]KAA2257525.1 hypothetical protein F0L68_24820 [Solihabitans fulvus]